MGIEDNRCEICWEELTTENFYYLYIGRMQQGPMSDKRSATEYALCMNCSTQIKAELMVSIQRRRNLIGKKT